MTPSGLRDSSSGEPLLADLLVRGRHLVGGCEITLCTDGPFLLDGGAMFGVVPKTLWKKRAPADPDNRVELGLNTAVVRTGKHTVVIETGLGNKQPPRMRAILGNHERLPASLAAAGVRPEEVSFVINTHLHFDHCGWNTTLRPDGSLHPTFPNARYIAAAGELAHAHRQLERDAVSYISENYDPLVRSGQMTLLSDADLRDRPEICPGISVELFPGHTAHMLAVHIGLPGHGGSASPGTSPGPDGSPGPGGSPGTGGAPDHACYIGDLIPTTAHLDVTWGMSYDLDPLRVIRERKRFYSRAIPEQWLVLFPHDHGTPAARITLNEKGKPVVKSS